MAEDISPALLKKVEDTFHRNLANNKVSKTKMMQRARDGTLRSVHQYSRQVGKALANAFLEEITPDVLPDGTLYYNIAQKVIVPPLKEAHEMVSDVADQMQAYQNRRMAIGLKPVRPPIQMERVEGLIDVLTSSPFFADNVEYLNEPIRNLVDHFADYHLEKNTEFLENTGIEVLVVRLAEATACEWCHDRAGMYEGYRDAQDNEAFSRHEGCRCELEIRGGGTSGKMAAKGHAFVRT